MLFDKFTIEEIRVMTDIWKLHPISDMRLVAEAENILQNVMSEYRLRTNGGFEIISMASEMAKQTQTQEEYQ